MTEMSKQLDRRIHAYRDDLADARLMGRVAAARYAEGHWHHVTATIAPLHPRPSREADLDTQALRGEAVRVFDIAEGWAWCQLEGDGYVGYVPASMLAAGRPAVATHKIASVSTFAYAEPNAASRPLQTFLFGTLVRAAGERDDFFELADGGYVGKRHVEPAGGIEPDFVRTACAFAGAPYLWGGKSVRGIDCSGLVQLALLRAGIDCPRDTDMQARLLPGGVDVTDSGIDGLRRGDIVYWPGHVAIMLDASEAVHASGTLMCTGIEPIATIAERSRKGGPIVAAVKRLYDTESALIA